MKRFYNYIMVGALALATTACNDSFLERGFLEYDR